MINPGRGRAKVLTDAPPPGKVRVASPILQFCPAACSAGSQAAIACMPE